MSLEDAEALALGALAFIAADERRLVRFLGETGLTLADLRAKAGAPATLRAALEHLLGDESMLLVHAAAAGRPPEAFARAAALLAGARYDG